MSLNSIITGVLTGAVGIVNTLSQDATNGLCQLGTFQAPTFSQFLTNNPLPSGFPWGTATAAGTNPYTQFPNTGVVRSYDFTVTRGTIAPDGYSKDTILINGQFPGPTIEANWGDTFQITVHNQISNPAEGTAFHWHGLLQKKTPYMDGVPSVMQCPIAPGSSFTYTFQAELYGSSWYHAHYSSQYAGGLLGPMIIHGPSNAPYDIDLGPVLVSDYYHTGYEAIVDAVVGGTGVSNPRPQSDNNLINGKGTFDCTKKAPGDNAKCSNNAAISKFKFTTGKKHRLRLINTSAEALQRFSIDGHNMTIIANDYVPVQPYSTNVVTLGVGQRTDVIVTANAGQANTAYWMRSNISTICSETNQPFALAAIYYDKADNTKAPTSTAWNVPDPGTCANDDLSLSVPVYSIPANTPDTIKQLDINIYTNATGSVLWTMDGTSFRGDYNSPILLQAAQGNYTFDPQRNVKDFGTNGTFRIVVNNAIPASHPMHFHGHNMQIIAEGDGPYDGTTAIRTTNPQRRDVQLLRPGGHMVWQVTTDNPGVWPFHCHIAWHATSGLYANIMYKPQSIVGDIPTEMKKSCDNWMAFTNKNIVDQPDSGV